MSRVDTRPDRGALRAWARTNGIPVSKTGNIARHVRESYLEAHPHEATEMEARNARPDLFALADDMVEAEMIRRGQLSFDVPEPVSNDTPASGHREPRSLSEWLKLRDDLAAAIAEHSDPREAAEALLMHGWMVGAAA